MRNYTTLIAALILCCYNCAHIVAQQDACFSSPNDFAYEGPTNAWSMTKGDFNNDGHIDVVIGNFTSGTNKLNFIAGNGDGSFEPPVLFGVENRPLGLNSFDFNNDGNLDLVYCNQQNARLIVMLGNGNGTFQAEVQYTTNFGPNGVAIADYNSDGFPDIVVSTTTGGFNIFFADPLLPHTFTGGLNITMGTGARGIVAVDFNNDGIPDVATSNESTNNVSVRFGVGDGTFLPVVNYPTGAKCFNLVSADFNGDGFLDIATTNETSNNMSILINDGSGSFLPAVNYPTGTAPNGIKTADLNGDGFLDIVVVNTLANSVTVFHGVGNGTFVHYDEYVAIGNPRDIVIDDFNEDGSNDAAICTYVGSVMPVLIGDGVGGFIVDTNFIPSSTDPRSLAHADFNNDGRSDMVVANSTSNTFNLFKWNIALNEFDSEVQFSVLGTPYSIYTGDFNNDGNKDVVTANYTGNNIAVFLGNGAGGFGAPQYFPCNNSPIFVRVADINDNGIEDVIVINEANQISVLLGTGTGTFGAPTSYATGTTPVSLVVHDFNNDGKNDVVVVNRGANTLGVYLNNGTGVLNAPSTILTLTSPSSIDAVDLNNDGNLDIIITNFATNNISRYLGNGTGAFSPRVNFTSTDTGPTGVITGDFNMDGNMDAMVIYQVSAASTGFAVFFAGNGTGGLTFMKRFSTGIDPMEVITTDFNGSGAPDVAVVNKVSNTVSLLFNTTANIITPVSTTFCDLDGLVLEAAEANTYLWSTGETTQSITVNESGSYSVITSSTSGHCTTESEEIVVDALPSPVLTLDGVFEICEGESTTITASGASTYEWSDGYGTSPTLMLSPTSDLVLTLTGYNANGCSADTTFTITVTTSIDASFQTLDPQYCQSDADITLVPVTPGGTFSGPGVTGDVFSPSAALGTVEITYEVFNASCAITESTSQIVEVFAAPDASFTGLNPEYCSQDSPSTLVPVTSGGVFSGNGITGSTFNPASASIGNNDITYEVSQGGCTSIVTLSTTVEASPDATFSGLASQYCQSDADVTLIPVTSGGTFTGTGVTGDVFSPSAALGTVEITYLISNGSCSSSTSQIVEVFGSPNASFSGLNPTYCNNDSPSTLVPVTSGGVFSGNGVTGSTFNPATASIGNNIITYEVTQGICTSISTLSTTVDLLPDATFSGLTPEYCQSDADVTLIPVTSGGVFSGDGVTGDVFSPSATLGTVEITYEVINGACTASTSQIVEVFAAPNASFSGLNPTYCSNDSPSTLVPVTSGGVFSGNGVIGSTFNPATASIGNNDITYEVTVNGCTSMSTLSTTVDLLPDATFSGLTPEYCQSDADVTLIPVTSGGVFSGDGVTGDVFSPSATLGTVEITYEVINGACTASTSQIVEVFAAPNASFSGLNPTYCNNDSPSTLVPVTSGGVFSGNGVTGSTFNPATAFIGNNDITYEVTVNGCTSMSTQSTTVDLLPDATFSGLTPEYCQSDADVTLIPVTSGGVFSGDGVTGDVFSPSATLGTVEITYEVINGACTASTSQIVEVFAAPNASFSGLNPTYCNNDSPSTLVPVTSGGVFSGNGVTGSTFNPATASIGNNDITYEVTVNGCTSMSTQSTTVDLLPDATFSGLTSEYCQSDADVTLIPVTSGGVFSGDGVTGDVFSPSATLGTVEITYEVTNGSCTASTSQIVEVFAAPNASFGGLNPTYCYDDSPSTLVPVTSGGVFSGNGVTGSTFNPATASIGNNDITYELTVNGCTSIETQSTTVDFTPDASFQTLNSQYCQSDADITLVPVTPGGVFSGIGVTGDVFSPSAALGTVEITYLVSPGACTASSSQIVEVLPLPNGSFSGLNSTYCSTDAPSTLVPVTSGGVFSGNGVTGSTFDPSTASIGNNDITYQVTQNGCTTVYTLSTTVDLSQDASFQTLNSQYCQSDADITLVPVTSGGTFTGAGVTGNVFSPSSTLGTVEITYEIVNGVCTSSTSQTIQVYAMPNASFSGLNPTYCSVDSPSTLVPVVLGGVFSGNGITGSTFNPGAASIGNNDITYQVTQNGCTSINTQSTTVDLSQDASFQTLNSQYCQSDADITLVPVTSGGTFTGSGVTGNVFSPSSTLGTVQITYEIINGVCTSSTSQTVQVYAMPNASFTGLNPTYCSIDSPSTLVPVTSGGVFSGNGITGSTFNPGAASIGNNDITYQVTQNGCTSVYTLSTTVDFSQDAAFSGLASQYCQSDSDVTLVPVTSGGTFTGAGVTGSVFSPSSTLGTVQITYEIINGVCTSSTSQTVQVYAMPNASFSGLNPVYCVEDSPSTLVPVVFGGVFSGNGVTGSTFNPATAAIGNNDITYQITQNGCTSFHTLSTTVDFVPDASFQTLNSQYCQSDADVTLVPVTPSGVFTGSGVTGDVFSPSAALGTVEITYEVVNGACSASTSQTVQVFALLNATFSGLNPIYCVEDSPSTLVPVTLGGVFSGNGITGSTFNPAMASIGNNDITYELSQNGCTSSYTVSTSVEASPDATFTGLSAQYCENDVVVNLVPTQSGGTFSGDGVEGSTFDPSIAIIGTNTITYTISVGSCVVNSVQTTEVLNIPNANFSGLDDTYCFANSPVTLIPEVSGGVFSGDGVVGNQFDPGSVAPGMTSVTYEITDGNGCSNSFTDYTLVETEADASFSGVSPQYCIGTDEVITLVPVNSGGTFSGDGVTGNQFNPAGLELGTYSVSYSVSVDGCTGLHIVPFEITSGPNTDVVQNNNYFFAVQDNAEYQWINCSGNTPIAGATSQSYTSPTTGTYAVLITYNGCTATSECLNPAVGLDEYENSIVEVYPNPNMGEFTVKVEIPGEIEIFDFTGALLMKDYLQSGKNSIVLGNEVSVGLYVARITLNGVSQQHKIHVTK